VVRRISYLSAAISAVALVGVAACSHSGTDAAQGDAGHSAPGSISALPQPGGSPASATASAGAGGKSGTVSGHAQPSQQARASHGAQPSAAPTPVPSGSSSKGRAKGHTHTAHGAPSSAVAVEVPVSTNTDPCKITTGSTVGKAFGAKVTNETAGRSGTGAYLCKFSLTKTNAGPGGTVQMSQISPVSAATFAKIRAQTPGAKKVTGVGDAAFYVPRTHTLQVRSGHTVAVISADLRAPLAPTASASRTRADLVALGRLIANQI
jgi:hypothetical protein